MSQAPGQKSVPRTCGSVCGTKRPVDMFCPPQGSQLSLSSGMCWGALEGGGLQAPGAGGVVFEGL